MKMKFATLIALAMGTLPFTAQATTVIPTGAFFTLAGTISVTNSTIQFSYLSVGDTSGQIQAPVDGTTFLNAWVGQVVTVNNLNSAAEPVATAFSDPSFMSFQAGDNLPSLTLTYIPAGVDGSSQCNLAPAPGQTCTPIIPNPPGGLSPFSFQNTVTGSTAAFDFEGITSDGKTSWIATFTSQFNVPFQTVLANLSSPNFSMSNSFSGSVAFTALPEPGTFAMMGAGLLLLGIGRGRLRRRS
jgi:hypothetical protein